jgi:hypothetical protein
MVFDFEGITCKLPTIGMQIKKARRKGKNVSTRGWLKEKSKRGKQEV